MTRNEIISELFLSKDFNDCINSRCPPHLKDDLKGEILLLLCEKDESELIELHSKGQLRFYIVRVILNQLSRNGQFYKKFRMLICVEQKETFDLTFNRDKSTFDRLFNSPLHDDELPQRLQKENFEDLLMFHVEQLHWYKAGLFKLYLQLGTFRAVAKHTRIPFTSVHLTLKEASKEIREKLCM